MFFHVFAWIGLLAYALSIISAKLTSKYAISNPWFFNFVLTLLSLFFTLPIALFNHVGMPKVWDMIIIAAFFNALWFIFYTFANYRLDVSVLSPLYNFRTIFTILFSALLLGERLNSEQFIYFIIIFIGGIFSSLDEKFQLRSFFTSSILIGIFGMLFLSLNNVFVKKVLLSNGFWEGTLWMIITTQVMLLATFPLFMKDIRKTSFKQINPLIITALFSVLGNICFNYAYKINVSITSLIAAVPASMILAFLFSVFAPKLLEKHTPKVYAIRFTGAIIMIAAALKLSL